MCISRLCQYFFLSSFLCAPPIAPSLSFSNCASTVSPFLTTSVCSSQLSAHSISSIVCPPSCSLWEVRAYTRGISRRNHLHLLSLQPNMTVVQQLEDLPGFYSSVIVHYEAIEAGWWGLRLNLHQQSTNTNALIGVHILKSISRLRT